MEAKQPEYYYEYLNRKRKDNPFGEQRTTNPNDPRYKIKGHMALMKPKVVHYQLWDYQIEAIKVVKEKMENHDNVAIISPTGSGKTVISGFLIIDLLQRLSPNGQILFIVNRNELVHQSFSSIYNILTSQIDHDGQYHLHPVRETLCALSPKYKYLDGCKIVVVSQQKFAANPEYYESILRPEYLIFDECHTTRKCDSGQKMIDVFPDAYPIGLTATPYYLEPDLYFGKHWESAIVVEQHKNLVESGALAPLKYKSFEPESRIEGIKVGSNGEFVKTQVKERFDTPDRIEYVVECWMHEADLVEAAMGKHFRKTIVFPIDIQHGKDLAVEFQRNGFNFEIISSKHSDRHNKETLRKFRNNELDGILSVGMLTTGFNEPDSTIAILCYVTMSEAHYRQSVGRITRKFKGKQYGVVMDFGGNVQRHRPLEEQYLSEETVLKPKQYRSGNEEPPYKTCEHCNTVNHAAAQKCMECGEVFPKRPKVVRDLKGQMIEIIPDTSVVDYHSAKDYYRALRRKAYYDTGNPFDANAEYASQPFAATYPLPDRTALNYTEWVIGAIFHKPRSFKAAQAAIARMIEKDLDFVTIRSSLYDEFNQKIVLKALKTISDDVIDRLHQKSGKRPRSTAKSPPPSNPLDSDYLLKCLI